ncbi:imidazoleglycerol-phosphate dehydratase [Erysipelotrichaceae bacterium]|nr:imidazoleglycerol-phosphate dehydratase [Erysipelotrichaceae bacterium]
MEKCCITRKTKETEITMCLDIYGNRETKIATGIGFFDHMLELMAFHAGFNLEVLVDGDLHVDGHHVCEDVGIVLGELFKNNLDKVGIRRYGQSLLPMDETLTMVALDLSNRGYLGYDCTFSSEMVGLMATELVEEFFQAFVRSAQITLHFKNFTFKNNHHLAESMFKGFGRALRDACTIEGTELLSTKGVL